MQNEVWKHPATKIEILHTDHDRILLTEALEELILDMIQHYGDKHYQAAIQVCYHICYLSK